ncbi:filamentous hemagglutinin N-terminal domain-containing protein [Campylobacter armoricus]|uniref:two-partner secretion domain-containing protein n=1 Tax=Campylobacter armoricus TaxID=2505970 RepID=UPI0022A7A935|nr:filamentous hemagglutinin N-terminal domain-containing protein [Campylobacter armoricus]
MVASLLFSSTFALPSGGKFTHGTTGTINKPNNNTLNIHGNGTNSVIQWGGGFSINQGESVNFNGNNKNYLNIAHGTSKSTIDGLLNANGNNVFLINPNGVIITKNGTINANRFVASTSSMDNAAMQRFANMSNFNDGLSFSPVFKPNKLGNVVNMGNINANNVLLIGNKVDIQGGKLGNASSTTHLVGNNVYIDADSTNLNSTINVTAIQGGYIQRQMNKFANDDYNFGNNVNINKVNYTDSANTTHNGISSNFKKALTIGNMGNEKANATEWFYFAKGWNENKGDTRNIDEFRLVGNVDFSGNEGKNYANYCMDDLGCASMIVSHSDAFTKTFDGQGYTLKNINIDTTSLDNRAYRIGIFGYIREATIKNINVDYMGGGIKADNVMVGGFAGYVGNGTFSNISLNNIGSIIISSSSGDDGWSGGFAGRIFSGIYTNISLNNIGNINSSYNNYNSYIGGFAGQTSGTFTNISLNNIGNISGNNYYKSYTGGFAGKAGGTYTNISLNHIGSISSNSNNDDSYTGGFAGIAGGTFSNISLNNIGSISASNDSYDSVSYAGSFAGSVGNSSTFKNIYIFLNPNMSISASGNRENYAGKFFGGKYNSSVLTFDNVHIYHHANDLTNANNDSDYWGNTNDKIQIHTYNDNTQESIYQDFLSKANTIEKPILPSNPSNPTNPDVILGNDDVISANDLNTWLGEILAGNYWIDINDLSSIKGISEELKQSISFLEALYTQEGMKEILESFGNDYKTNYKNYQKFATNKANLLAFINDKLKPLVKQYNKAFIDLKTAQEQLKIAIEKYNDYVKKVNENPSIKNDATLNALKAEVDRLDNLSKELFASINNNQELLQTYQDKTSTDSNNHFKIIGKFDNVALLIPNLDEIVVDGNENEDYKKVSRQVANAQKQTPTFEYEEDEKEEVEEASMKQRSRTCIVSDNYKTMNPCVVEIY